MNRNALLLPLLSMLCTAWTPLTDGDVPLVPQSHLEVLGNPLTRGDTSPDALHDAVVGALERWQAAAPITFDYWQDIDLDAFPPMRQRDGVSTVHFAAASGSEPLAPGVVAWTRVWTEGGRVVEFDVTLNDLHFVFVADRDEVTSQNGRVVVLGDVVLHELGHALGLDHSGALDATMWHEPWPGQGELSCDDAAGLQALVGSQGESGSIAGRATFDRQGIPGLAATLVDPVGGRVLESVRTAEDGHFTFERVPPGAYHVLMGAFVPGARVLADAVDPPSLCEDGIPWRWHGPRGQPVQIDVLPTHTTELPDTDLACHPPMPPGPLRLGEAVDVSLPGIDEQALSIRALEGDVVVRAWSYSLLSPVAPDLWLTGPDGLRIDGETPVYQADGLPLWDGVVVADDLPAGDYTLHLRPTPLAPGAFPGAPTNLSPRRFALVTVERPSQPTPCIAAPVPYAGPTTAPPTPLVEAPAPPPSTGCSASGRSTPFPLLLWLVFGLTASARCARAAR